MENETKIPFHGEESDVDMKMADPTTTEFLPVRGEAAPVAPKPEGGPSHMRKDSSKKRFGLFQKKKTESEEEREPEIVRDDDYEDENEEAENTKAYLVSEMQASYAEQYDMENTVPLNLPTEIDDTREISVAGEPEKANSVSEKTQVLDIDGKDSFEPEGASQMMLDGFSEEVPAPVMTDEERLRQVRQEKIQDFSQRRGEHLDGNQQQESVLDEEDNQRGDVVYPETTQDKSQPAATEKYVLPEQVNEHRQNLLESQKKVILSLYSTALLELVLLLMTVLSALTPALSMNPSVYLALNLILFVAMLLINIIWLYNGFVSLFKGKPNVAGGVSLITIFTLIHTVLQTLNTSGLADGSAFLLTGLAGFGILMMQVARRLEAERILRNFRHCVMEQGEKYVAKLIDDPNLAEEIGRPAVALGEPRVAYGRKTTFVSSYFENAGDDDWYRSVMKWYLPMMFCVAVVVSLIYFFVNGLTSWLQTITFFCTILSISTPALVFLVMQTAMLSASMREKQNGAVITGLKAVGEYGMIHAVALDAMDIFPENTVLLHGIKTFSGTRIDDAILDAASVSIRAGGPLSHVFRRMILDKVDMLHDVDTLVYEQDMGLSGWVSGRRVLIGDRKLLDNHGIDIPSGDYEERYAKNGRKLVYLSIAGELSAMFVVSYIADPDIKQKLTHLTRQHTTLLVRTCDQNITEELITSVFNLNGFYVERLNAPAGRSFEAITDGVTESEPAVILSRSGFRGFASALTVCRKLRKGERIFAAAQLLIFLVGLILISVVSLFGDLLISPVRILRLLVGAVVALEILTQFFYHE